MTTTSTGIARRALLGAALALTLPLSACGGSDSSGSGPNPAAAVPAAAPIYLTATVRPEGDLKDDTLEVAGKLLNTDDPQGQLKQFLQRAGTSTSTGDFDYDEDLKPWLGQQVGIFVMELKEGRDTEGALVFQVTDADKARESLAASAKKPAKAGGPPPKVTEETYEGTTITVSDDRASAVLDDYALAGSLSGVKASIDTVKGGDDALADKDAFKQATSALGDADQTIASFYLDVQGAIDQAVASGEVESDSAAAVRQAFSATGYSAVAAGISVQENALRVDIASPLSKKQPDLGNPSAAVAALPGDSWLGLGIGDVQKVLEYQISQFSTLTALGGTADLNTLIEQLGRQLDLDIREDLLSWMGEGAIFLRGTSLADIGGAAIVQVKDQAKAKAAFPAIEKLVKAFGGKGIETAPLSAPGVDVGFVVRSENFPLPIDVALAGDRFIVAVTDPALEAAISPSGSLGDNSDFKAAAEALGDGIQPTLYLGFRPVLELVEGFGLGEQPTFKPFKPTLDALRALAAGGNSDDDVSRQRVVLTLND